MKILYDTNGQTQDLAQTEFLTTRPEDVKRIMAAVAELICPVGVPLPYYSALGVPEGFIALDGKSRPRNDYPLLAAKYGPIFGQSATGSKTFNTPDMTGFIFPSAVLCPPSMNIDMFITRAR